MTVLGLAQAHPFKDTSLTVEFDRGATTEGFLLIHHFHNPRGSRASAPEAKLQNSTHRGLSRPSVIPDM